MGIYAKSMNVGGGLYVASVSAVFDDMYARPPEVKITLRGYMHDGLKQIVANMYKTNGAVYVSTDKPREEWSCLYCATPNNVERAKCEQCGAPRNWCF